jgi:hypothetical protein
MVMERKAMLVFRQDAIFQPEAPRFDFVAQGRQRAMFSREITL